nr:junctional sarcoplasmic reticulum protein 1 [Pelodiscus sinensis]|eukprot:XP_006129060.1 junctional sarcoplasmic reticulum protein 1 [Pelodiscus sinensis]
MATDTCEVWETELEDPEAMEELPLFAEHVPGLSLEDLGQDAEVPQREEEADRAPEMEPEERGTLHVIEQDLEEFVESMTDTPGAMETHMPRVEEEEETSADVPEEAPQSLPVTRKVESRAAGKEAALWAGLSLNKCILLASVVALLSLGFQALRDASDVEAEGPDAEPRLWAWPQSSLPEQGAGERVRRGAVEQGESWRQLSEKQPPGFHRAQGPPCSPDSQSVQ